MFKKQTGKNLANTTFNVKQIKQKPLEARITWKVFLNFILFYLVLNSFIFSEKVFH